MDIKYLKKNINQKFITEIEYYEELDSTHILAKETNEKISKLIIADNQIGGIGTKGRKWYSEAYKNIAMTLVIFPNCNINKMKNFTIEIAKSIKEAIKNLYDYELTIKEPNDLLLNGKKICGILTEARTLKNSVRELYISIGFNVNEKNFPDEIINIATSLNKEMNKEFNREEIIIEILKYLEILIKKLLANT